MSYGNSMFNFLGICQTLFHNGSIIFTLPPQSLRVPIYVYLCQYFSLSIFLIIAIVVGGRWYLTVVLTWISLMTNDVEHLYICLLVICIYSLGKCLLRSFAIFKLDILSFYCWIFIYAGYWGICLPIRSCGFYSWVEKIPWRRKWQPIPVFLPGKSHREGSLVGYSPWGHNELDII